MRQLTVLAALLFGTGVLTAAQETPRVEVFAGYSYLHASFADAVTPGSADFHGNLNGWDGSVAFNASPWLGVVADFGGYYGSPFFQSVFKPVGCVLCTQTVNTTIRSIQTFMGGPKLSRRRGKATVFGQALFGGSHISKAEDSFFNPQFITPPTSSTNFSMSLGGGVDWQVASHLAVRAQPDYLFTHFFGVTQHNFRLSTGVVFRFGK